MHKDMVEGEVEAEAEVEEDGGEEDMVAMVSMIPVRAHMGDMVVMATIGEAMVVMATIKADTTMIKVLYC